MISPNLTGESVHADFMVWWKMESKWIRSHNVAEELGEKKQAYL